MKQAKDLEQLIDRAIANERGTLPQQPMQPPSDLLSRVASTPIASANAALSASATGVSLAVKVGIVALIATGSATWWVLSQPTQRIDRPTQSPAPQQTVIYDVDSLRKKKDSTAATAVSKAQRKQQPAPAAAEAPFVPSEQNLPVPSGALETHVKDSTPVHLKVK